MRREAATFESVPCRRCGATTRYEHNSQCVPCKKRIAVAAKRGKDLLRLARQSSCAWRIAELLARPA